MAAPLTIGEFSQITHLSIRTLRRHHEAGLLEPDEVDDRTGYRYYGVGQVATAQVIHRLRDLGMPIRDVREVLATSDPDARAALIAGHLDRLEGELERTRVAVTSLRRLLRPDPDPLAVELRTIDAVMAAAVSETVDLGGLQRWVDGATVELDRALADRGARGAAADWSPAGLYDNELFTGERGRAVVYRPTAEPPTAGRVRPLLVPAAELAVTTHAGSHDDIDVTYGALGAWVAEHALAVSGPVHETYLVGPADTPDPTAWRTEIGWPVFRTSPAVPAP